MLTPEKLDAVTSELASRPGHEKVRVLLYRLLVDQLGVNSTDIDFEKEAPEVQGRMDALLGRTVLELKSNLKHERKDAENKLTRYLTECEKQTDKKFVGIATDGADFIAYFLRNGNVVEVGAHHVDPAASASLLTWLRSVVAIGEELQSDPDTIMREFGRESLAAQRALDDLDELWSTIGQTPEAQLKRQLWDRLLGVAYGTKVGDDTLFLQHTYLVVVAKAIAWDAMIETPPQDAEALLHGAAFTDLGITGQSEPDFFDWLLSADSGSDLVVRISRQVHRFRLQDIRVDILRALYESLIDPKTRHYLGEYYTPDWLAARMVEKVVGKPLEQRVMDPACGSGTFLFHLVRAVLDAADAAGIAPAAATRLAVQKIAGVDIHPVAIIFSRMTYLLALLPALRKEHPGEISLPVYLGDALQWNLVRSRQQDNQIELFADDGTLEIFVPSVKLDKPKPRRLDEATLRIPAAIASDAQLFDRVLTNMIKFGGKSEPPAHFEAWMKRKTMASAADRRVLLETYEVMRRLQGEGRNHIWGYVARNLARPIWLASEAQKADIVIGNPPWLAYRHMKGYLQEKYKKEAISANIWWTGRGTSANDLSAYFYVRTALLYMRLSGRIALVMPYAAMSRQAYSLFRRGEVARAGHIEFRLRFTEGWAFGPKVKPLFPVPSCVLFAEFQDQPLCARLPDQIESFSGTLLRRDASRSEAAERLVRTRAPWPAEASNEPASCYLDKFRQGAILIPRRLILVEAMPVTGKLPPNPEFPLVRGRVGKQDKEPWKNMDPPVGAIEKDFLRPVLLGESIAPFRVLKLLEAVIPLEREKHLLLNAKLAASQGYPRLSQWLEKAETLWNENGKRQRSLLEQYDFFNQLSAQFPIEPIRVVYTKSGTNLAASVVSDETVIIDHLLYWAAFMRLEEARFLCGILNSEGLRSRVEKFQNQGQRGARHFDKYVFNVPIPKFDDGSSLHCVLASAARTAEEVANAVPEKEGEHFTATRKRIRSALAEDGIAAQLEQLVTEVLKVA